MARHPLATLESRRSAFGSNPARGGVAKRRKTSALHSGRVTASRLFRDFDALFLSIFVNDAPEHFDHRLVGMRLAIDDCFMLCFFGARNICLMLLAEAVI